MIIGNGIDIIEIERIRRVMEKKERFLDKIFSNVEREYINLRKQDLQTIAGMFAAKEAISKTLGTGIRKYKWTDLQINHDPLGKPIVKLNGEAERIAKENGINHIHLSISHINKYAIAYAIAEGSRIIKEQSLNAKEIQCKDTKTNIIDEYTVKSILPMRKEESHKGTYGRISVIAGSKGMTGASYLTSMSCLRSGSGIVYSVVPNLLNQIMETKTTEIITKPVEDSGKGYFNRSSISDIIEVIKITDVVALGPGLGIDVERVELIRELFKTIDKPVVLDADGINCISKDGNILINNEAVKVITPHPGELDRLLNVGIKEIQSNRVKYARLTSEKYGVITVLKGSSTVISSEKGEIFINNTGNPGMATAGSGDVLTGIITSFIGQGIESFQAAIAGVYIHGLAGDLASQDKGEYGIIATDILENIPYALKRVIGK